MKLDVTRIAVFTPATKTGKWYGSGGHWSGALGVDDPHEEVGGEERPEEHDLRADEEEHPEGARVDPGALVRDRRPVMVVGVRRLGVGGHELTSAGSSSTTC